MPIALAVFPYRLGESDGVMLYCLSAIEFGAMKYVTLPLCNVTIGSLDRRDQDKQTELDVTLRLKLNRRRFEAVDVSQTETQGV